jgi:uncharacterized protein YceH (UPF0502 family)
MTEPSGDLETRVAALEARVGELAAQLQRSAQDATAARVLAGGADRDVDQIRGEIRDFRQATTASFNAMREDLTDLRQRIDGVDTKVDTGFAEMRGKFDATAAGLDQITGLLNTLLGRPDGEQPSDTPS